MLAVAFRELDCHCLRALKKLAAQYQEIAFLELFDQIQAGFFAKLFNPRLVLIESLNALPGIKEHSLDGYMSSISGDWLHIPCVVAIKSNQYHESRV